MSEPRSLAVQSVLYGNHPTAILRAAEALANSVARAREAGRVSSWELHLGDCSPEPVLTPSHRSELVALVGAAGGSFTSTVFGANLGSAAGHNALAAESRSELMLILNPDAQVAPEAVGALARRVADRIGIAEARQVPLEHPKEFLRYDGDTSWASTACALTLRAAFDAIGGFDSETFFLYCDDVDYSWRLRIAGYRVVYEPAAAVFHDKRLTLTGDWLASDAETYYSAEAAIMVAFKYSRSDRVRSIIARFRKSGSEPHLRAVREFELRQQEGRLPTRLDHDHQVAQFVKDNYAVHRF